MQAERIKAALERIAREDPELGARLTLMSLPAAAAQLGRSLSYDLSIDELGTYRVELEDGRGRVEPIPDAAALDRKTDFRLSTDARTLTEMAAGVSSPLRLMLGGRLRIHGKRRRALKLRALGDEPPAPADIASAGGRIDPDVLYRALRYLIDPEWTRGHRFTVCYELHGELAGRWYVEVRDGEPLRVSTEPPADREPDATARVDGAAYRRIAAGELSPAEAMQNRLTLIDGQIHPVTLLGRWIDRAQGRDDAELAREERQREVQDARGNILGADGARPTAAGQGDPGHDEEAGARDGGRLLGYRQLYALWERQNWRAQDLDFTLDREHWLASPGEAQGNMMWSLGSFYVGEERVTADLAPFLLAAPGGEIELFLATQLVDEARHAAFFDRFGAEVMALSADDLRGRMREVGQVLPDAWRDVFDDGLRAVANRIKGRPDDVDLFVEGITTYHMVIEGFLAVTGQTLIRDYMEEHGLYPGFCEGFSLVERDEHRHVAFGVRFLRDAIEADPARRAIVERTVLDLAPRAAHVFCPPYADDPSEFVSYGYRSSEIYGFAYRTLRRRMRVLGIELPPAQEMMPGPIEEPAAAGSGTSG